ncbi:hypothetical protein BOX15_Mlig025826g5, partial [Macrostomum lignano]
LTVFGLTALELALCLAGCLCRLALRAWLTPQSVRAWSSSPVESWTAVREYLALRRAGVDPYDGSALHLPPLSLRLMLAADSLLGGGDGDRAWLVLLALELAGCLALKRLLREFGAYTLRRQAANVASYCSASVPMLLSGDSLRRLRLPVIAAYWFNPYSLVASVAEATTPLSNLVVLLCLAELCRGRVGFAAALCAAAAYHGLYPLCLIVPICLAGPARPALLAFAGTLACLLAASYMLTGGSWAYLQSVYAFHALAPDHTPGFSLSWYLFCEAFDHFRSLFQAVFQANLVCVLAPLAIRFRSDPCFLAVICWAYTAIFKPYCCVSEQALIACVFIMHAQLHAHMRRALLAIILLIVAFVLAPIMHHLWLYPGSANSNFYFAISLLHCTAMALLLYLFCIAYLKREFLLHHGPQPLKFSDGTEAKIVLQAPTVKLLFVNN